MVLDTRKKILEAFFELAMEHPNKLYFSLADIAKKREFQDKLFTNVISMELMRFLIISIKRSMQNFKRFFSNIIKNSIQILLYFLLR
ncbi:hypothetical protein Q8F58_08070 [Streptococcus intermedius]|nr:hypothetical protein [Streptococcus intermedius]MDP1434223.1 hypothetical protein [Streptococcus intermedius]